MNRGETKYPPAQGTVALRPAAPGHLLEATGGVYPVAQIIVSTGAKQVIFNGLAATLNEGDEVLIPAPPRPPRTTRSPQKRWSAPSRRAPSG
ncbi:hypothetical protein G6F66_015565 [Rhizopus arrhizus]|nr:hypothetical protein G6F66_015565 [Rhizopus arrhizus]